jgi:hypothetical protein
MALETLPELADPALDGDHERLSHIVPGKARLTEAMINGTPVMALCGKVWVPSRDPKRYSLCGTCKEEFERLTGKKLPA